MENNKPSSIWTYVGLVTLILLLAPNFVRDLIKSPKLIHYVVKINSPIQENDFEKARIALENSIFQNVNDSILRDPKLTYSEALDKVLPASMAIAAPQSGIVVVIQNNGDAPAHNVQVDINLQVPIENYKVFSNQKWMLH